jgi:hypothetical protein
MDPKLNKMIRKTSKKLIEIDNEEKMFDEEFQKRIIDNNKDEREKEKMKKIIKEPKKNMTEEDYKHLKEYYTQKGETIKAKQAEIDLHFVKNKKIYEDLKKEGIIKKDEHEGKISPYEDDDFFKNIDEINEAGSEKRMKKISEEFKRNLENDVKKEEEKKKKREEAILAEEDRIIEEKIKRNEFSKEALLGRKYTKDFSKEDMERYQNNIGDFFEDIKNKKIKKPSLKELIEHTDHNKVTNEELYERLKELYEEEKVDFLKEYYPERNEEDIELLIEKEKDPEVIYNPYISYFKNNSIKEFGEKASDIDRLFNEFKKVVESDKNLKKKMESGDDISITEKDIAETCDRINKMDGLNPEAKKNIISLLNSKYDETFSVLTKKK